MIILLSCAKTMSETEKVRSPFRTTPRFAADAKEIAVSMSLLDVSELEHLLRVNPKIAVENYKRFQAFLGQEAKHIPALWAYTGIVFKRLAPKKFSDEELLYAQDHLRITSFCYGLLRPFDEISPYRLEGDVKLPELSDGTLFSYWRSRLTDLFISEIEAAGGLLCYLASDEMRGLFDWRRVEKAVRIITPEFRVWKNGRWTTIVVYTKMCRGEMSRYILQNKLTTAEELLTFQWEGFDYNPALSSPDRPVFTQMG